ncbi:hypothetical protein FHX09_002485 [Rhizobium sp. BK538]|nr:hypothetical protein [Rhizobium sp. BK060]MBB4168640.1 hypothetical protein [Rhizobium sp. BK538]TCM73528.1 hypothetical protein EV291_1179 [Rhizobium sp. BK068]
MEVSSIVLSIDGWLRGVECVFCSAAFPDMHTSLANLAVPAPEVGGARFSLKSLVQEPSLSSAG